MICPHCGGLNDDKNKVCVTCGKPLKPIKPPKPQEPTEEKKTFFGRKATKKEPKKLKQLPVVLKTTACIMIANAIAGFAFIMLDATLGASSEAPNATPYIADIFLAISLLRGLAWARTWILIRCIAGLVIFGGATLVSGDLFSLIIQAVYALVIIFLLFGVRSKKKAAILGILYGLVLAAYLGLAALGYVFIIAHQEDTFVSKKFNFEISRPSKGWIIIPEGESMDLKIPGEIVELSSIAGEAKIAVMVYDAHTNNVGAIGESLAGNISKDTRNTVTDKKYTKICDMDAYEIAYSTKIGVASIKNRLITTVSGDKAYNVLIAGAGDALSKLSKDIDNALGSIKIKKSMVIHEMDLQNAQ